MAGNETVNDLGDDFLPLLFTFANVLENGGKRTKRDWWKVWEEGEA